MSDELNSAPSDQGEPGSTGVLKDYAGVGVGVSNVFVADLVGVDTTLGKVLLLLVPFMTHGSQRVLDWWQSKAESKRRLDEETALTRQIKETIAEALADPDTSPEFKERLRKKAEGLTEGRLEALIETGVAKGILRLTEPGRASETTRLASGPSTEMSDSQA